MSFAKLKREPQGADLAINDLAGSMPRYATELATDSQVWAEAAADVALGGDEPGEGQTGSFRTVLAPIMVDTYSRLFADIERRGDLRDSTALGLLGMLAFSDLLNTPQFWAGAGDRATTTGDDWDAGIDLSEAGRPHVHYPSDYVARALGSLPAGAVEWYRNDAGLYLAVEQSMVEPTAHTTVTPYLPSTAALRRAGGQ